VNKWGGRDRTFGGGGVGPTIHLKRQMFYNKRGGVAKARYSPNDKGGQLRDSDTKK